jgi:Ca-activated chloride channel family protein
VSFDVPWRLVFIVAPIALLVAYLIGQRARRKYALRFTSVDLLASVAPRRAGWQRHISAGLMLLAVLFLVVGFARPTRTIKVAKEQGTIMLAIDTSGSMAAADVPPTRLAAAAEAAKRFVDRLPPGLQVGLLNFSSTAALRVAPTSNHAIVDAAIDALTVQGGTATGPAIKASLDAIAALPTDANATEKKKPAAAIVLMSDGTPTIGAPGETPDQTVANQTAAAKDAHIAIDTIAFGTPDGTIERQGESIRVPADPEAMKAIARGSDGKSFTAQTANQLDSVYDQIRRTVGYDSKTQDITAWFTGIGLLIAILSAIAALVFVQRMP